MIVKVYPLVCKWTRNKSGWAARWNIMKKKKVILRLHFIWISRVLFNKQRLYWINSWHLSVKFHETNNTPDSKVRVANMGPTGSCWPHVGPMLAPWTLLSGTPRNQPQYWQTHRTNGTDGLGCFVVLIRIRHCCMHNCAQQYPIDTKPP